MVLYKHWIGVSPTDFKHFSHVYVTPHLFQVSHHNHGPETIKVISHSIKHGRQLRLQSLNNYRRMFNLDPHTSFEEMTGIYNNYYTEKFNVADFVDD